MAAAHNPTALHELGAVLIRRRAFAVAERHCTFVGASLYFRFFRMGLQAGAAHGGLQKRPYAAF